MIFIIRDAKVKARAAAYIMEHTREGDEVRIGPQKRNLDQNARLHAALTEIAGKVDWAGSRRSVDAWKRLLVAAWMRAEGRTVEVLPAIDGHGVDIVYSPTSELSRGDCASLIDFVDAWAAEQGIALAA
jgi:hypothetical protein